MLVVRRVVGLVEKSKNPSLTLRVSLGFPTLLNWLAWAKLKGATSKSWASERCYWLLAASLVSEESGSVVAAPAPDSA